MDHRIIGLIVCSCIVTLTISLIVYRYLKGKKHIDEEE